MAMGKEEIMDWLSGLPDGCSVGVDDGGLCLRMVGGEEENWCEVGGLPEEEEDGELTEVDGRTGDPARVDDSVGTDCEG